MPRTLWRCFYVPADSPAIACMLATAAPESGDATAGGLPPLVARIRRDPAYLDGEAIFIPLHSPPIENAFAERLARSVMCGGTRPDCGVQFVEGPDAAR
jgi:hypothetical protein